MDDRPQFTGKKPEWNTNKVILVAIGSIWTLAFLSALFTSAAGPSRTFMAFPLLGSFLIAGLVIFFAIFTGFHARRVKPMVEYDRTRFNLFLSSMDALSLGLGVQAPPLVVLGVPFPDSYVTGFGSKAIVVTPSLLELDLTDQEVEAIMAAGLAKMIDLRMVPSWPDIYSELKVEGDIIAEISMFTWDQDSVTRCASVLRADALAARLTGQPGALQSAIVKLHAVFEGVVLSRRRSLHVQFIEIPPSSIFKKPSDKLAEELTRLRLENLERIEAGKRPDFSELRDGRPVVGPKGWE
ncbi:MAG TPA: hypothetical protein VIK15_00115 [Candidatus Anoxymicrobiaceae bacterium]